MTVAKLLQQNGYATACVGKWHLGHFLLICLLTMVLMIFRNTLFERYAPCLIDAGDSVLEIKPEQGELTRRYTEYAVDYIKRIRIVHSSFTWHILSPYAVAYERAFRRQE